MPPPGFFLRFAPHVQDLIIDFMGVPDILKLANLSEKAAAIVKSATASKRFAIRFCWIDDHVEVWISDGSLPTYFGEAVETPPLDLPILRYEFDGLEVFTLEKDDENPSFCFLPRADGTHRRRALDLVKDLFSEVSIDVLIDGRCDGGELLNLLKDQKIQKLEWAEQAVDVRITAEDVEFVLDEMDVDEVRFNIEIHRGPEFRYSKPLTNRKVYFEEANWLDVNAVLHSTSEFIYLNEYQISSVDVNAILKHWVSGEMEHLVRFIGSDFDDEDDGIDVFKDIKFTDWNPKVAPKTLRLDDREEEFDEGHEIARFDGTRRAIVVADYDEVHRCRRLSINVITPETLVRE